MALTSSNPQLSYDNNNAINLNSAPTGNDPNTNYTSPTNISIDWSCKASPVINQGACGSCYVIAAL
jgi:hypothetical protein